MQVIEVTNRSAANDFLKVNVLMNANNPKYIRPLDNEVNEVFDPKKNKAFKYGNVCVYVDFHPSSIVTTTALLGMLLRLPAR